MNKLENCYDCGVKPGKIHISGCDIERCSVCGSQYISCGCKEHDPVFSRWTGIWPGSLEADFLGITLNEFYMKGYEKIFFVKLKEENNILAIPISEYNKLKKEILILRIKYNNLRDDYDELNNLYCNLREIKE